MTSNGVVVGLVGGCAAAAWTVLRYPPALAVAVACGTVLAIGVLQRLARRGVPEIALSCPSAAERGDAVTVTLAATHDGTARVRLGDAAAADVMISKGTATAWTTPPLSRGRVSVRVDRVRDTDALGLWRWRRAFVCDPITLTVLPRRVDLAAPPLTLGEQDRGLTAAVPGAGAAFAGLREYLAGDDVRHIDWAASARSADDVVYVRQFAPSLTDDLIVVLDDHLPDGAGPVEREAFETAVDLAYSFSCVGADLCLAGEPSRCHAGEAGDRLLWLAPRGTPGTAPAGHVAEPTVVITAVPARAAELQRVYRPSVPVFRMGGAGGTDLAGAQEAWARWATG
jgi:uncharacterized protein (DUF58 family)